MKEICRDFVQINKEMGLWKYEEKEEKLEEIQYEKRIIQMYRYEMTMGKDLFLLRTAKASVTPFIPLTCYPDQGNKKKYQILLQKQKMLSKEFASEQFEKDPIANI